MENGTRLVVVPSLFLVFVTLGDVSLLCMESKHTHLWKQNPAGETLKHMNNIISPKWVTRRVPHEILQNWRAIYPCAGMKNKASWPSNIRPDIKHFFSCKFHFISLVNMLKTYCMYFAKNIWNFQQHSKFIVSLVPYYPFTFSCDTRLSYQIFPQRNSILFCCASAYKLPQ